MNRIKPRMETTGFYKTKTYSNLRKTISSYDGSFSIFFYAYELRFYDVFFFYHKA